jgi:MerC mercury resistance protein
MAAMMSRSSTRCVVVTLVALFALLNPPTFALATTSIASRAKTTAPRHKILVSTPHFMSSSSSTGTATTGSTGNILGGKNVTVFATAVPKNKLFDDLRQVSNFASMLCVLDCTVLPIMTVALPLLGIMNLGPARMDFLHHLGHKLALYFVLPVGGSTGLLNYLSHKKKWIASLTAVGLVLVGFANSHIRYLPFFGHVELLHVIQHGPMHRVVNIVGCGFLLGSNYLSQKQGCAFDHESSSHNHDHSHSHDHSHGHSH